MGMNIIKVYNTLREKYNYGEGDIGSLEENIIEFLEISRKYNPYIEGILKEIPNPSQKLINAVLINCPNLDELNYIKNLTEDNILLFIRSNKKYLRNIKESDLPFVTDKIKFEIELLRR